MHCFMVAVALFCATCSAAVTDAHEEACADLEVNKQLVQTRAKIKTHRREAEDAEKHQFRPDPNDFPLEPEASPTPLPDSPDIIIINTPTPAPLPKLAYKGANPKGVLGLCTGDCDNDAGCENGLRCFQRNWYTTVPGCAGIGSKDTDYCYDPELPFLPPLVNVAKDPEKGGLKECYGDCDSDLDCMKGLACFQRDKYTPVPGCSGKGKDGWDYCYTPVLNIVGKDPKAKLGACSGDCDSDKDCASGLECKQRDADEEVPGCFGEGVPEWDYCWNRPIVLPWR